MARKVKLNVKDFEKLITEVAEKACKRAVEERIAPAVKERLRAKARHEVGNLEPKKPDNIVNKDKITKQKKALKNTLQSDSYIKISEVTKSSGGSGTDSYNFSVFYDGATPNTPLWNWNNGDVSSVDTNGELLAQWIVDGKLVIHPALTIYKGQTLLGSDFNNPFFPVTDDDYTWKKYVQQNKYKPMPYVDHVIRDLVKNKSDSNYKPGVKFSDEIRDAIIEMMNDELNSKK